MTSRVPSRNPTSSQQRRAQAVDEIAPGDVLQGKFRVERIVGRGGMGVVIEATNIQLDQKVALKLLATGADDPAVVERFSREARAAARLKSEHVARVYDVGKDALHGPFIVMEMLEGKTLAETITAGGPVPLHRAVEYVIDACEGLAEAHSRGIVHQDVKPGNLFLVIGSDGRPTIKLLDFGIATMRSKGREVDGSASANHPSAGTPAYLAPEQIRGTAASAGTAPVDHHADIWALGCVLFELLTGDRAFKATRFTELVTKILEAPRGEIHPALDIPIEIVAVVDRCLEKDPTKRFKSTAELALALLPFARRRAHAAVARAVAQVKAAGIDSDLEMPSSMPPRPSDAATVAATMAAADGLSSGQLRPPNVPRFSDQPDQISQPRGDHYESSQAPTTSSAAPGIAPSKKNRGLGIAILALLVVVLAVGGMVGMRLFDRRRTTTTTVAGQPPQPQPSNSTVQTTALPSASTSVAVAASAPASSASTPATGTSEAWRTRPVFTNHPRGSSSSSLSSPLPTSTPAPGNTESEIRHNR